MLNAEDFNNGGQKKSNEISDTVFKSIFNVGVIVECTRLLGELKAQHSQKQHYSAVCSQSHSFSFLFYYRAVGIQFIQVQLSVSPLRSGLEMYRMAAAYQDELVSQYFCISFIQGLINFDDCTLCFCAIMTQSSSCISPRRICRSSMRTMIC